MGLSVREGEKLKQLSAIAKNNILEIGSLHGKSTRYLAQGAQTVYAIDLWDMVAADDNRKADYTDPQNYERFLNTIKEFDNVVPVKGSSREIAKVWSKPIGLLFIDGDHTYEGARADYENFSPFIVSGGLLVMHDYHNPAVRDVIETIVKPSGIWVNYKVIRYLFVARKQRA
jgi:predicted O-methyltransferase YrrM